MIHTCADFDLGATVDCSTSTRNFASKNEEEHLKDCFNLSLAAKMPVNQLQVSSESIARKTNQLNAARTFSYGIPDCAFTKIPILGRGSS